MLPNDTVNDPSGHDAAKETNERPTFAFVIFMICNPNQKMRRVHLLGPAAWRIAAR